jgi:hypothetical protein
MSHSILKDYSKQVRISALTQSNLERLSDPERLSNFENYVKASRAKKIIVDESGNYRPGKTYWSEFEFDGYVFPAQGQSKDYCKKWLSWGCNNTKQHPEGKHFAQHEQKTCKTSHCPKCHVSWINRQANRTTRRCMKFLENKNYKFKHIVLSPPQERAKHMSTEDLKKWLTFACKVANIKTCAVFFHPARFHDNEKVQPKVAPHFHLLVYGRVTNTTEFFNKTRWMIKNKGNLERDVDIFNCAKYLLSHTGVKKGRSAVRYLGDISYRKLKVEKEPKNHNCAYCELPLTIFFVKNSPKSLKPPIDHIGLWEKDCFAPYYPNDDWRKEEGVPFYELMKDSEDYTEERIYSFEDMLAVKTNFPKIRDWKNMIRDYKFPLVSLKCKKLDDFLTQRNTVTP